MRRRKRDSSPSKYILTGISAVCICFMLLSYVFGFQGGPLGTIGGYLFVPIQKGINYVGWYLSDRAENLQGFRELFHRKTFGHFFGLGSLLLSSGFFNLLCLLSRCGLGGSNRNQKRKQHGKQQQQGCKFA